VSTPIREIPTTLALGGESATETRPDVSATEDVLAVDNIQGNVLGGFNKDHQTLVFLEIEDAAKFKVWLKTQIPFVSTAAEVITFNRLFKAARSRRKREGYVKSTWLNVAFTHRALKKLSGDADAFTDPAFRHGLRKRSKDLGDPHDGSLGDPKHWVVGGDDDQALVVFIVAADDRCDMLAEVDRLETSLETLATGGAMVVGGGARVVFKDEAANLPAPLKGHEHFGFLDGVSQPGIRGRVSDDPTDVLTPRENPAEPDDQGKPGQDLLWPGEFVFGYPGQDPTKEVSERGPDSLANGGPGGGPAGPTWAKDGSYLVFRRLRQDVAGFHEFLRTTASAHGVEDPTNTSAARLVGSRLVGRWPSGAPVLRVPDEENVALANDDCANNYFEFQEETDAISGPPPLCGDTGFPTSPGDKDGLRCPFTGHIRRTYPRDDVAKHVGGAPDPFDARKVLGESDTQTHRLLRRGIPYGPVSPSSFESPVHDEVDRGLHFLAYQTSIERQFEFVIRAWVNNAEFKEPFGTSAALASERGGHDPIIGQNPKGPREFTLTFPDPASHGTVKRERLTTSVNWVAATGGGYFFAPSIRALETALT
jgi:Dyp-type peroxidase family